ncbi:MAG: TRAP transporter small permease subunit [Pseudomonadota bacterium]
MEECQGFFHAVEKKVPSCLDAFQASGALQGFFGNLLEAVYNTGYFITHPGEFLGWLGELGKLSSTEAKTSLMKFIYYGGSIELFYAFFTAFLILTAVGLWRNNIMWGCVRLFEGIANYVGRFFAWAGLLMVLQQIIIVFMQRIFVASELSFGFGRSVTFDVSWWAEELKFYNAMVVCMCCAYTFVQGGHVRVDLVYSAVSFRTKRIIDMFGSLIFMIPAAILTWMYAWYFLWRHLVVPKPSASDAIERLITKARALRWNVETIGFSPNGFNAYFLFKFLLIFFTAMVLLQAVAFLYRSYLEFKEGEESEGKYLDKDKLGDADAELTAEIH